MFRLSTTTHESLCLVKVHTFQLEVRNYDKLYVRFLERVKVKVDKKPSFWCLSTKGDFIQERVKYSTATKEVQHCFHIVT